MAFSSLSPASFSGDPTHVSVDDLTIGEYTWRVVGRTEKKGFLKRTPVVTVEIAVNLTPTPATFSLESGADISRDLRLPGQVGPVGIYAVCAPDAILVDEVGAPISDPRIVDGALVLFDGVDAHAIFSPTDCERFLAWLASVARAHNVITR